MSVHNDRLEGVIIDALPEWKDGPPWKRAAAAAYARGEWRILTSRKTDGVYLVRFWLSPGVPLPGRIEKFDSGASIFLHWIWLPDDQEALHDHPWSFTTTILSGGYLETLPKVGSIMRPMSGPGPGPGNLKEVWRGPGSVVQHDAEDVHRVSVVKPDTWTLVTTTPKRRTWGFHPPGKPWVEWNEFLGVKKTV